MKIKTIIASVLLAFNTVSGAEAVFDLSKLNEADDQDGGLTYPLNGNFGQVFDTSSCLPIRFNRFEIDVDVRDSILNTNTSIRLDIYTNTQNITIIPSSLIASYLVNSGSQTGLTWNPTQFSGYTGSAPLPPDVVPVTSNLMVVITFTGQSNVSIQNVVYDWSVDRVDKGAVLLRAGRWVAFADKLALRLYVSAEQPDEPTLKIVSNKNRSTGQTIRKLEWLRGLDGTVLQSKAMGALPTDPDYDSWITMRGVSAGGSWYQVINTLPAPPKSGYMYRLKR